MTVPFAQSAPLAPSPHVEDGDLVRLQDGELPDDVVASVTAHLAACRRCARRGDALRRVTARLRAAGRYDVALPAELATPPWRPRRAQPDRRTLRAGTRRRASFRGGASVARAAAALSLLAAAAAATPSLRATVGAWVSRDAVAPSAKPLAPAAGGRGGTAAPASQSGEIAFAAVGDTLHIAVRSEEGDSVIIRASRAALVRVRFDASGSGPSVVLLPDGVRLVSAGPGRTAYVIDVPRDVRIVQFADERRAGVRTLRPTWNDGALWRVALP